MSTDPTKTDPAAQPSFLDRVRTGVADAVHVVENVIRPGEEAVEHVVAEEIPAIEAEVVAYGLAHAPTFAADEVAALIAAVPQLSGFQPQLLAFATTATTKFLQALAAKFPAQTPTEPKAP